MRYGNRHTILATSRRDSRELTGRSELHFLSQGRGAPADHRQTSTSDQTTHRPAGQRSVNILSYAWLTVSPP